MTPAARLTFAAATAAAILPLASTGAAASNCYETIGCVSKERFTLKNVRQLGCQPLWEVRNQVFHARKYCFKSERAIELYGNSGCKFQDEAAVPLNAYERHNMRLIRQVEAEKGC